jgi:hypothetical protein
MSAQGWSAATTLGDDFNYMLNPERVRQSPRTLSGFNRNLGVCPRVLVTLEPWADISQRLRRYRYCADISQSLRRYRYCADISRRLGVIAVALILANAFGVISLRGWWRV